MTVASDAHHLKISTVLATLLNAARHNADAAATHYSESTHHRQQLTS
jgi:hypothetical protein